MATIATLEAAVATLTARLFAAMTVVETLAVQRTDRLYARDAPWSHAPWGDDRWVAVFHKAEAALMDGPSRAYSAIESELLAARERLAAERQAARAI
jgi:hypothetical protein